MAQLAIAALGPLRISLDGAPLAGFEYNKVRALLVYLALESDRPHTGSHLAALLPAEAEALFVAWAHAVRPGWGPTSGDVAAIGQICQRLDGLPLAIELIVAGARKQLPAALLRDLDHGLESLAGGPRDAPAWYQTLRNAIAWTCDRLTPEARRVFACLGVFAGGGSATAVQDVVGDGARVSVALEHLADHSLITIEGSEETTRFTVLATIREFALELLRTTGDAPAIAAALNNLGMVAANEGHHAAAIAHYEESLRMMRALNDVANGGNVLLNLGLAAGNLGDNQAERSYLNESLAAFQGLGHKAGVALVLFNLGNLDVTEDDLAAGMERYAASLALCRELGDRANASYALFGLGDVAFRWGDYATARSLMGESLALRHEAGERRPMPRNFDGLAQVDRAEGQAARAARLHGAAAAFRAALGVTMGVANQAEVEGDVAALRATVGDAAAVTTACRQA